MKSKLIYLIIQNMNFAFDLNKSIDILAMDQISKCSTVQMTVSSFTATNIPKPQQITSSLNYSQQSLVYPSM